MERVYEQERLSDRVRTMVAEEFNRILSPRTLHLLIVLNFALLFCFAGIGLWAWGKFNHNEQLQDTAAIHRGVLDKQVARLQAESGITGELSGINDKLDEIAGAVGAKGAE